jgi:hypothetical protein
MPAHRNAAKPGVELPSTRSGNKPANQFAGVLSDAALGLTIEPKIIDLHRSKRTVAEHWRTFERCSSNLKNNQDNR